MAVRVPPAPAWSPRRLHADVVAAMGGEASLPFRGGGKTREREYGGDTKPLDQFSRDLARLAAGGMLDPVVGRDREINRVIQIPLPARRTILPSSASPAWARPPWPRGWPAAW